MLVLPERINHNVHISMQPTLNQLRKKNESSRNRIAAQIKASEISVRPARKIPTGTTNTPANIADIPTSPNQK